MNDSTSPQSSHTPTWVILGAVLLAGLLYIAGQKTAARESHYVPPVVSVSGEGKVQASPDIASLTFGVQTAVKRTAKEAMEDLSKNMNAALAAVKKEKVQEKDITTEGFYLNPSYDYSNGRQTIIGYQASQNLRVKIRDLDAVSDVLAAATNAGANQAGGVMFTIDDPEKARAEAREKAIAQAKEKAEIVARQLGMRLSKVTGYNEGSNGYTPPIMYGRGGGGGDMVMESKAMDVPLPAGDQDVIVTVTLTYELR